ncbi:hypothetical protein PAEPH01_1295 [Pancytospora epiphaga]|nr:hypothetical protein PAEPH01_1295 [Pancytospora epiphaga]
MRSHSIQEIVTNENCEVKVGTHGNANTGKSPRYICPRQEEITLIEVGITSQNRLVTVET